jgi:hypothetical protein
LQPRNLDCYFQRFVFCHQISRVPAHSIAVVVIDLGHRLAMHVADDETAVVEIEKLQRPREPSCV